MSRTTFFPATAALVLFFVGPAAAAEMPAAARISQVEAGLRDVRARLGNLAAEVQRLRSDVRDAASQGGLLFLFGAVCALWAQNSGRNPWLWFFLGLALSVIAAVVVLYKNAHDRRQQRPWTP